MYDHRQSVRLSIEYLVLLSWQRKTGLSLKKERKKTAQLHKHMEHNILMHKTVSTQQQTREEEGLRTDLYSRDPNLWLDLFFFFFFFAL